MSNLGKYYPLIAAAALLLGSADLVSAQPLSCSLGAGVPPIVRSQGLAEMVGHVVFACSGGTPTPAGAAVPTVDLTVQLNTAITSRLLGNGWSEALLLIDEPEPSNQLYCTTIGGCPMTGVGGTGVNYAQGPNVFPARQEGTNSLSWKGIPVDPPGATGTRILRFGNIRSNASQLGVSSTMIPTQIVMFVSAPSLGTGFSGQTVGYVVPDLEFSMVRLSSENAGRTPSARPNAAISKVTHVLRFKELFNSAFRKQNQAVFVNADTLPAPVSQNTFTADPFSESGFYNSAPVLAPNQPALPNLEKAGLATHGTRLRATFTNVPAGVSLFASVYSVNTGNSTSLVSAATAANSAFRLITTDASGEGAFLPVPATNSHTSGGVTFPTAPIAISNGTGSAVLEVVQYNNNAAFVIDTLEIAIGVSTSTPLRSLLGLGNMSVSGGFAPHSNVTEASEGAPVPRFTSTGLTTTQMVVTEGPAADLKHSPQTWDNRAFPRRRREGEDKDPGLESGLTV